YVPFTAHFLADGDPAAVGVRLGARTATIDASLDGDRAATLVARGEDGVDLVVVASRAPTVRGRRISVGPLELEASVDPTAVVGAAHADATQMPVDFAEPTVTVAASVRL